MAKTIFYAKPTPPNKYVNNKNDINFILIKNREGEEDKDVIDIIKDYRGGYFQNLTCYLNNIRGIINKAKSKYLKQIDIQKRKEEIKKKTALRKKELEISARDTTENEREDSAIKRENSGEVTKEINKYINELTKNYYLYNRKYINDDKRNDENKAGGGEVKTNKTKLEENEYFFGNRHIGLNLFTIKNVIENRKTDSDPIFLSAIERYNFFLSYFRATNFQKERRNIFTKLIEQLQINTVNSLFFEFKYNNYNENINFNYKFYVKLLFFKYFFLLL